MKEVNYTPNSFLKRLISLTVAEVFLCSSILPAFGEARPPASLARRPAWAAPSDFLRPRPAKTTFVEELEEAADGGSKIRTMAELTGALGLIAGAHPGYTRRRILRLASHPEARAALMRKLTSEKAKEKISFSVRIQLEDLVLDPPRLMRSSLSQRAGVESSAGFLAALDLFLSSDSLDPSVWEREGRRMRAAARRARGSARDGGGRQMGGALEQSAKTAVRNRLMARPYLHYNRALRSALNRNGEDFVVAVGGAGPDISNVLQATDFNEAYFIDTIRVWPALLEGHRQGWAPLDPSDAYFVKKYLKGWGAEAFFRKEIEFYLIQELKALGVRKDDIRIGSDAKGRALLTFLLPGDGKRRRVIFIEQDLDRVGENRELNEELRGRVDAYYEKASFGFPTLYSGYMNTVAGWIKPGGFIALNTSRALYPFLPEAPMAIDGFTSVDAPRLRHLAQSIMREVPGATLYGLNMSLFQKNEGDQAGDGGARRGAERIRRVASKALGKSYRSASGALFDLIKGALQEKRFEARKAFIELIPDLEAVIRQRSGSRLRGSAIQALTGATLIHGKEKAMEAAERLLPELEHILSHSDSKRSHLKAETFLLLAFVAKRGKNQKAISAFQRHIGVLKEMVTQDRSQTLVSHALYAVAVLAEVSPEGKALFDEVASAYLFRPGNGSRTSRYWVEGAKELLTDKMPEMVEILTDRDKLPRFLMLLSILRNAVSYEDTRRSPFSPVFFAKQAGFVFKVGDLHIVPGTESFRRHIIYTERDGELFAIEIKVPGREPKRAWIDKEHIRLTEAWRRAYPKHAAKIVRPLFSVGMHGEFHLYEAHLDQIRRFKGSFPLRIVGFEYKAGKRLLNVLVYSRGLLEKQARRRHISRREYYARVATDLLTFVIRLHRMGESQIMWRGTELHLDNFRLLNSGEVVYVGDFMRSAYRGKTLTLAKRQEEASQLLARLLQDEWSPSLEELRMRVTRELSKDGRGPTERTRIRRQALRELILTPKDIRYLERYARGEAGRAAAQDGGSEASPMTAEEVNRLADEMIRSKRPLSEEEISAIARTILWGVEHIGEEGGAVAHLLATAGHLLYFLLPEDHRKVIARADLENEFAHLWEDLWKPDSKAEDGGSRKGAEFPRPLLHSILRVETLVTSP